MLTIATIQTMWTVKRSGKNEITVTNNRISLLFPCLNYTEWFRYTEKYYNDNFSTFFNQFFKILVLK